MCGGTTFRTVVNSSVALLVLLNIAICSTYDSIHTLHPAIIDNDEYRATETSPIYIENVPSGNDAIPEDKRAGFSVNSGLRSLVEMLYSQERRRRHEERAGMKDALLKLGKRGWSLPWTPGQAMKRSWNAEVLPIGSINRRAPQQLSVSGPLSALASMLDAETNRRKQHATKLSNRLRLLDLGKRSGHTDMKFEDKIDESENDSFDKEFV